MQNLMTVWSALTPQRRLFAFGAAAIVFFAIIAMARGTGTRDMSLLFGGLEPAAAGNIVTVLDQRGAVYEVRGNSIYVPTSDRDALRMSLAGEGLPASGAQGYELLDSLSGFGTTSQMFDAAYWRAKEGELARTITASPNIQSARVHISAPNSRGFQRVEMPSAALTLGAIGSPPSQRQVKAFQFLVAAAVPGLTPENVAVIDSAGGLLSDRDGARSGGSADTRADALRLRAERLLAARVGPGNAVVEVTIEEVTEAEQITEHRFDPDERVVISTETTESASKSQDSGGGDVTVASNLPEGDAGGSGSTSNNENTQTRALTNFEVSETQRLLTRAPGDVKRLTVAVLVNEVVTTGPDGERVTAPRDAAELAALEALVSSAVGLNPERGDAITLRSMPFEPILPMGTEGLAVAGAGLDVMRLVQMAVLAAVALILGLFVVRPILAPNKLPALAPPDGGGTLIDHDTANVATLAPARAPGPGGNALAMPDQSAPPAGGNPDDPVTRLRQMISERESETIQVLQDWMEEPENRESV